MSQVFRGAFITFFSSGVLFAVNVLASIFLVPAKYGELSASINSMTLVGLFLSSGVSFYVVSIGSKDSLNAVFIFLCKFFLVSCFLFLVSLLIYRHLSDRSVVDSVIFTFPAAASIGLCLVLVGYFQLSENYEISAAISAIPNLIKSAVLLYMMVPILWLIETDYVYWIVGVVPYLIFISTLVMLVNRHRNKSSSEILRHNFYLLVKFALSNFLVSAYTAMVIPVVFLTYGADHSAVFSIFFIFWSLLNMAVGYLYGNYYLIKLKKIHEDNRKLKMLFNKIIRLGLFMGLAVVIFSIVIFKVCSFNFWREYAEYEFVFYVLFITLCFRSISAASGLFLSLGGWIKWKNIAQCIFLMILYLPIALGADFKSFVIAYFFAEAMLMVMYFSKSYLRVHAVTRLRRCW